MRESWTVLWLSSMCRQQVMCFSLSPSPSFHPHPSATPAVRMSLLIDQALLRCNRTLHLLPTKLHRLSLPTFHPPPLCQRGASISALGITRRDGGCLCDPPPPILAEPPPPCPMSATPSPPRLGLTGHMNVYLWCPDVLCRVPLLGCRCPTSSKWKGRDKGNNLHYHDAQGNVSF